MSCCTHDCRQGRDCPARQVEEQDKPVAEPYETGLWLIAAVFLVAFCFGGFLLLKVYPLLASMNLFLR